MNLLLSTNIILCHKKNNVWKLLWSNVNIKMVVYVFVQFTPCGRHLKYIVGRKVNTAISLTDSISSFLGRMYLSL